MKSTSDKLKIWISAPQSSVFGRVEAVAKLIQSDFDDLADIFYWDYAKSYGTNLRRKNDCNAVFAFNEEGQLVDNNQLSELRSFDGPLYVVDICDGYAQYFPVHMLERSHNQLYHIIRGSSKDKLHVGIYMNEYLNYGKCLSYGVPQTISCNYLRSASKVEIDYDYRDSGNSEIWATIDESFDTIGVDDKSVSDVRSLPEQHVDIPGLRGPELWYKMALLSHVLLEVPPEKEKFQFIWPVSQVILYESVDEGKANREFQDQYRFIC